MNPAQTGTKCAAHYVLELPPGGEKVLRFRFGDTLDLPPGVFQNFDSIFAERRNERWQFRDLRQCVCTQIEELKIRCDRCLHFIRACYRATYPQNGLGAFTGAIAGFAAGAGLNVAEAALLNGVAGGIADQLQGGSFGHGFISAGAAAFFGGETGQVMGPIDKLSLAIAFAQIAGRAIVGGLT